MGGTLLQGVRKAFASKGDDTTLTRFVKVDKAEKPRKQRRQPRLPGLESGYPKNTCAGPSARVSAT